MEMDDKKLDQILNLHTVPEPDETLQQRIVKYATSHPQGDEKPAKVAKQGFWPSIKIGLWQGIYGTAVAAGVFAFVVYTGLDKPSSVEQAPQKSVEIAAVKEKVVPVLPPTYVAPAVLPTAKETEKVKAPEVKTQEAIAVVSEKHEDVYDDAELSELATLDDSAVEDLLFELYEEEEFEEELLALL